MVVTAAACRPDFQLKRFTTNESLYTASLREFQRRKWDNAVAGFEKLTTSLAPRDTLLPRSYWYLASAHEHIGEHLLAAQSFNRLVETFPEDTLADDAALEAARSYAKLWRSPALDPMYGETALATYNTLLGLYPDSPLIPTANAEIAELNEKLAKKNYNTGVYYLRRKCYDCANIYFKDVLTRWPEAPTARAAALRLVESYKAIHYNDDATELCAQLRKKYTGGRDIDQSRRGLADKPAVAAPDSVRAPKKPPPR